MQRIPKQKPAPKAPQKPKRMLPPENRRHLTKDWVELEKNVMICSGSYSQTHKRFKGVTQQGPSICIVACAFANLRQMDAWTKTTLNAILDEGTKLYLKTRQLSENRAKKVFAPTEIYRYFFLDNVKVSMRFGLDVATERIVLDSTMLQKLENFITNFFNKNVSGILACQEVYFTIWKQDKYFFIFDPTEHDLRAGLWREIPSFGFCYCIRCTTPKFLADLIIKNCDLKMLNKFILYPCSVEKYVIINTKPPETLAEIQPIPLEVASQQKNLPVAAKKVVPIAQKDPPKVKEKPAKKVVPVAPKVEEKPATETPATAPEAPSEVKKTVPKSQIPPRRPKLQSVTNFLEIATGRGILRASTHQRDPKFTRYMGAQSLANSIAVLTMLRQYKAKVWIKKIVDDILRLGEHIHHDLKKLPSGEVPKKITLNDIDYTPKIEQYRIMGRLTSDDDKVLSLEEALRNTLLETDCCIVIGPQVLAVWKEDNRFYMFDPEERNAFGGKIESGQSGVACVTWFNKVSSLVELYLANTPKNSHKSRFMINKVTIKDYVPPTEDWFNFKALTPNKWILRGNFSQKDRRFPPESRNTQCTVNSTMALTYKELKDEKEWDARVVDQVLINGDELYRDCVNYLQECGRFKHRFLMVDEVKRNFDVEEKRVMLEVDDCLVNGVLNARSDTGIPDLRRGFEQFFLESDAGIVTANCLSMAVWKKDNIYYYYDSHSRNEKGVVCGYGTACILRMITIDDLANALLVNLGPDSTNLFNISRVVVRLAELTEDGVVKPPLNSYDALSEIISILRSSTNHNDKKFTINAGKQEVPMCLVALAFNSITASNEWTRDDLDQVLTLGNELYAESMAANYGEDVPEEINVDDVTTTNVKTQMSLGPNSFNFEFEELASGNIEENLKEALSGLEIKDPFGAIIESEYMIASIWKDDNSIFLFDPRSRDERGQVYGKDDWSVKKSHSNVRFDALKSKESEDSPSDVPLKPRPDEDEEKDDLAGGDNLGEPEQEIQETEYEPVAKPEPDVKVAEFEEGLADEEAEGEVEIKEDKSIVKREKMGSEFWRLKEEEEGKACVMRYSRLEDLITHVLENSPPNRRPHLDFSLKLVRVNNTPVLREIFDPEVEDKRDEFAGDWNEFKEIDYGKWILRSVRDLKDGLFPVCNRGNQALPMAIVSLAFAYQFAISKFTQEAVDSILAYGDRLYTVVRKMRIKELKDSKELRLSEEEIEQILTGTKFEIGAYPRKMCMGEKLARWEVKQGAVKGDISSKTPETVLNLTAGLTAFFGENNFGIVICRDYPVAVWKTDDIFYMFDPHATGPSGAKSPIGVACITRFKEVEHLAEVYLKNLSYIGENFFEIHAFTFEGDVCVRPRHPETKEGGEKQKTGLIGGFNEVTVGKSILRGDLRPDCTKFDRGVHLHSAPIAFVALALSLSKDPDTWTRIIINEILRVGEELYLDSLDKLGDKFDNWSKRLDVCHVNTDFTIGKLKVNSAIRYTEQRGIVDIKNSKTPNLRQGLERFFEENSHGILVTDRFVLAIWEQMKDDKANIFLFDPNSRGNTGLPGQGGVACVLKFCNAKLASDHLMACMMDIDKTKTEFAIIPVEIVVGAMKTKRKVCKALEKAKQANETVMKVEPCVCPPGTSRLPKTVTGRGGPRTMITETTRRKESGIPSRRLQEPTQLRGITQRRREKSPVVVDPCTKLTPQEQKRAARIIAEQERARKEEKRCHVLGRNEIFQISDTQAIIRGLKSIVPDRELPVNLVAFAFMKLASDLSKWSYKQIEMILEGGYQLYIDSYNTYKPETTKLSLQYVLRRVLVKDYEAKLDIRRPIIGSSLTKENLLATLTNFFMVSNFCIIGYKDLLVSLYFKSGYYYMFDPYSRDIYGRKSKSGTAILMRFGDLSELAELVVYNLRESGDPPETRFALIVVGLASVERLAE